MTTGYGTLCTDFYVNQKIAVRMDLPSARETILSLCDRVRREFPAMERFRRFDDELALESTHEEGRYSWMALQPTSVRSGWVNPQSLEEAYRLHRMLLEITPYFLSISPIDVEYVELVFGFDMEAGVNRNEVVFDALYSQSPLSGLIDDLPETPLDTQPFLGFSLNSSCELQGFVEVKTRTQPSEVATGRYQDEPISVYITVRQYAAMKTMEQLQASFGTLAGHAERLAEQRVIPCVVMPIREAILSHP